MFAELHTTDENLPTVSSVWVKGNSAAIFELVATYKVPVVITSALDSSFPLMVLRPAVPNIDSCWSDIAKSGCRASHDVAMPDPVSKFRFDGQHRGNVRQWSKRHQIHLAG